MEIVEDFIPIIAILSAVALPITLGSYILINLLKSRHRERLELIQQGLLPSTQQKKATPNKYVALRNGFLCVGIALGAIIGLVVNSVWHLIDVEAFIALVSSVLLFLGVAYISFYFVTRDNDVDEDC